MNASRFFGLLLAGVATIAAVGSPLMRVFAPSGATLAWRGVDAYKAGNYDEAKSNFEAAIRMYPDVGSRHSWLGSTLRALGDLKGAKAEFQTDKRLVPHQTGAYVNLASVDYALGQYDEGLREATTATTLAPTDPVAWIEVAYGDIYLRDDIDAITAEDKGLALSPGYPHLLLLKADSLYRVGKKSEALSLWRSLASTGGKYSARAETHLQNPDSAKR